MKNKIILLLWTMTLLAACSTAQAIPVTSPVPTTRAALQTPPTADSASDATNIPATDTVLSTATFTPKPPLEKDAWMQMPAVPSGISDSMRSVYEQGLALGNDPKHFSIIGDCQNVSSYFLSVYDLVRDDAA